MSISTQITVAATAETIIITAPGALRGPMGDVTPEAQILVERAETAAAQSQSSAGQAASSAAQAGDSASQAGNSASSAAQSATAASDSETAAGLSASSAQSSASSATDSASSASSSAGAAQASAGEAQTSASAADQSATDAAQSAASAQEDADATAARVARFLAPSAVEPTQRDNGQPLQVGDQWPKTTDGKVYSWTGAAWVALDSGVDELRSSLADQSSPPSWVEIIGMDGRWLYDYLKQREYFQTIEYFGPTDNPSNTKTTMQIAINACAALGILLRGKASSYTIDVSESSITIPNNFRCDLGAKINRQTGNQTPHDMWINADSVNGNTGLSIKNVWFDGKAQVDGLSNANPSQRFCGLRLIKCEGRIEDVRADSTVNGEYQAEGTRGGIMLEDSVYMECIRIRAEDTIGTGFFIVGGSGSVSGFIGRRSTGSGLSGFHPGWVFENLRSEVSGYSGISLNGPRFRAVGVYSSGAPAGFAGVNFGHVGNGNEAESSSAIDVTAENNQGWGINCSGAPKITGRSWKSFDNASFGLRVTASPGSDIELESIGGLGVRYQDTFGLHALSLRSSGATAIALVATTTPVGGVQPGGIQIVMDKRSDIQTSAAIGSAIQADRGCQIIYRGILRDNLGWAATANDAGSVVVLDGANVFNNANRWRGLSGGIVRTNGVILSPYAATSGTFTIPAGVASVNIPALNAVDRNSIFITAINGEARSLAIPTIANLVVGVGFDAVLSGSVHPADAAYSYAIR